MQAYVIIGRTYDLDGRPNEWCERVCWSEQAADAAISDCRARDARLIERHRAIERGLAAWENDNPRPHIRNASDKSQAMHRMRDWMERHGAERQRLMDQLPSSESGDLRSRSHLEDCEYCWQAVPADTPPSTLLRQG